MNIKGFVEEDFANYKKPSMFIATCRCTWKCCIDGWFAKSVCQNSDLANMPEKDVEDETIYNHYISNPITKAVVIGGLEPFLQFDEVYSLIDYFRSHGCNDPFVIYTGYYKDEIRDGVEKLAKFPNIIIKFGRYIPGQEKHFDDVLGVELASDNQYAEKIS